jgi:hypothetical protein
MTLNASFLFGAIVFVGIFRALFAPAMLTLFASKGWSKCSFRDLCSSNFCVVALARNLPKIICDSKQYLLKNSAILDSGTTIHIYNEISRFLNCKPWRLCLGRRTQGSDSKIRQCGHQIQEYKRDQDFETVRRCLSPGFR